MFRLPPTRGGAAAQCNLGVVHTHGTGVPQDHTEAVQLYQLAADQGLAQAQYNLSVMYANGARVPQDATKAAQLLKLGADQGFQLAQDALAHATAQYPRVRIIGLTAAANRNSSLGSAVPPLTLLAAGQAAVRIDGQTKITSLSCPNITRLDASNAAR